MTSESSANSEVRSQLIGAALAWLQADSDEESTSQMEALPPEEFVRLLSEVLVTALRLKWPQGASLDELWAFTRGEGRYSHEDATVQPLTAEAVLRAANGDSRFVAGVAPEVLLQHVGVAAHLLIEDLALNGITTSDIAQRAADLANGERPSENES